MLLAGDVGGTKTFLGLFTRAGTRPQAGEVRSYRTLDFPSLGAMMSQFLRDTSTRPADVEAASFGVAGPITGRRAQLTNVPWMVDLDTLRADVPVPTLDLVELGTLSFESIEGIPREEGRARMDRLVEYATSEPFRHAHGWRRHDLVIWDEASTNHRAADDHYPRRRRMQRCAVAGTQPYHRTPPVSAEVAAP